MLEPPAPSRRQALVAVALAAVACLYVFPYFPGLNNPNENVRLYMTAALVEEGTYRIDNVRSRWGWVNDAACVDHHPDGRYTPCETPVPLRDVERHYYSVKAPGSSILGVPVYALYRWAAGGEVDRATALWLLRVTTSIVPFLVFLFFYYRFLRSQSGNGVHADAVFLAVAIGSPLLAYSYLFVSHTLSAATAFGAFLILRRAAHGRTNAALAFAAGLLAAGTTYLEYPCLIASFLLTVYAVIALRRRWQLLPFGAGALIPTLAMMHFQKSAYGSAFTPGHLMVENPSLRAAHHEGIFGADAFHPEAAWNMLFDFRWGLFTLTPILLLAIPGFVRLLRRRAVRLEAGIALALVLLSYLAITVMNNWWGGWSVGPRYLAVVYPFVGWAALAGLDAIAERWRKVAAVLGLALAAAGLVAAGLPSMLYPHIPPEIRHPLPELYALLLRHDFAPLNGGALLDVHGTISMLPMARLAAGALVWVTRHVGAAPARARLLAFALPLAAAVLVPHALTYGEPRDDAAIALVTRQWHPAGFDRAARLDAELQQSPDRPPEDYRRLADLYFEEGRTEEAETAIRRSIRARAR